MSDEGASRAASCAFLSARIRCSTPGLEHVTARELERKLGALRVTVQAGSVEADIALSRKTGAEELFSLRSVEQLSAVLFSGTLPVLKSETSDGAEALEHIARAVRAVPAERWCGALTLWERCCRRQGRKSRDRLSFKVTKKKAYRNGNKAGKLQHAFTSTELGQAVFRAVQKVRPGWTGVLEQPELTIFVRVHKRKVLVCIPLCTTPIWEAPLPVPRAVESEAVESEKGVRATAAGSGRASLFSKERRNLGVRTPLKPTIAYGLVMAAEDLLTEGTGHVIVDPCCGSGTIGECACIDTDGDGRDEMTIMSTTTTTRPVFVISGDMDEDAVTIAADNASRRRDAVRPTHRQCCIDVVRWDATRLPLRDCVADRFVSDLPFGRKCGSRTANDHLYTKLFREISRVTRRGPVAATLLSCDRKNLLQRVQGSGLEVLRRHALNIGGLNGAVVVLRKENTILNSEV